LQLFIELRRIGQRHDNDLALIRLKDLADWLMDDNGTAPEG